jgi:hypothetical protein
LERKSKSEGSPESKMLLGEGGIEPMVNNRERCAAGPEIRGASGPAKGYANQASRTYTSDGRATSAASSSGLPCTGQPPQTAGRTHLVHNRDCRMPPHCDPSWPSERLEVLKVALKKFSRA